MGRQGLYPDAPPPPCVLGYEGSGIIDLVGEGNDLEKNPWAKVGARVLFFSRFGAHADTVVLDTSFVFPMPDNMTFEEGAAIPVVYLTAYHCLFRIANLRPKESVLIQAAAGGVGTAAIQLAKTVPGVTIYGTASASKHEAIKKLGCDHTIDYRTQQFDEEIAKLTNGKGVNVILDAVGGDSLKRGYKILKKPGRLISFGASAFSSGSERSILHLVSTYFKIPTFNPMTLMGDNALIAGVNMLKFFDDVEVIRDEFEEIISLYEKGLIKPIIDEVFKFSQVGDAHKKMQERQNIGKVVLVPDEPIEVSASSE